MTREKEIGDLVAHYESLKGARDAAFSAITKVLDRDFGNGVEGRAEILRFADTHRTEVTVLLSAFARQKQSALDEFLKQRVIMEVP